MPDPMNIHVDHGQLDQFNPVFSPGSSSMASPGSPNSENSGGGKMARKKSTASTTSADEDDISNIPSLQTRIQIISQRVCSYYFFMNYFVGTENNIVIAKLDLFFVVRFAECIQLHTYSN
jgi:hypothetical protein